MGENFSLVEADFQQYYGINLDTLYKTELSKHKSFWRYSRLFSELPPESRTIMKLNPVESWDYAKSAQSRILQELRIIASIMYNVNKRKGSKAAKPEDIFEPDYVSKAREDYLEWKKEQDERAADIEGMANFWENRTKVKMVKSSDKVDPKKK